MTVVSLLGNRVQVGEQNRNSCKGYGKTGKEGINESACQRSTRFIVQTFYFLLSKSPSDAVSKLLGYLAG